jgi:hypothetical protein
MSDKIVGYWVGATGKFCTKEEYDGAAEEARKEREEEAKWRAEHPEEEYDW